MTNDAMKMAEEMANRLGLTVEQVVAPNLKKTAYKEQAPLYPEQREEFRLVLDQLWVMHEQKSADYGPANINAVGETGIAVRIWDKAARLMHLLGWDLATGKLTVGKTPRNESLEDTLLDLASYCIIMVIYRRGLWGK